MVSVAKLLGAEEGEAERQMHNILEFAKEVANVSHNSLIVIKFQMVRA